MNCYVWNTTTIIVVSVIYFSCAIGTCTCVDRDIASNRWLRSAATNSRSAVVTALVTKEEQFHVDVPSLHHRELANTLQIVVGQVGTPIEKLAKCQGDCDGSTECQDGLICMQRSANEPVPGCLGLTSSKYGIDFCIDPNDTIMNPTKEGALADDDPGTSVPTRAPTKQHKTKTATTTTTTTTSALSGHCRQEQLDFSTCLSGKAVCRQCFAPILGQQSSCDSLEESVCNVLNTDACECDRCARVFKSYYDCVSDNVCSALQCDGTAGIVLQMPTTPAPAVLDKNDNNNDMKSSPPTPSPVPLHNYKGSTVLKDVGNNEQQDGISLGRCEGDCDTDDDCDSDLICFQREGDDSTLVPGCIGTPSSDRDYCIDPYDNPSLINSDSFRLKIFWREGYKWQDESFERPWCMQCSGSHCNEGDEIVISKCDDENTKFRFINQNTNDTQIAIDDEEDLCIEVPSDSERTAKLAPCDENNPYQKFWAGNYTFTGDRFEIQPIMREGCLTQQHHPKEGEHIYVNDCGNARRDTVSIWNKY